MQSILMHITYIKSASASYHDEGYEEAGFHSLRINQKAVSLYEERATDELMKSFIIYHFVYSNNF